MDCVDKLRAAGREDDAALFDFGTPNLTLASACDFRWTIFSLDHLFCFWLLFAAFRMILCF